MTRHPSAPPGAPSTPAATPSASATALQRLRPSRRSVAAGGLLLPLGLLAACSDPVPAATGGTAGSDAGSGSAASDGGGAPAIDTSGTQEPIRAEADEEVAALLPAEIAESGVLRVGINGTSSAPLSFLADDNQTYIGSEIDIARIVADKLGLEFELKLTTWENWPLKLEAGEFDVVHANVGINAERLQKFDFASYRAAFMSFLVKKGAEGWLEDAESLSGKIIAVGAATNQERILTDWNAELEAAGKEPAELKNYSTEADTLLALGSGRVDGYIAPFASLSFVASRRDDVELQGRINAGWPDETLVAGTFPAGSGLAEPYAAALNALIADGTYARVLERWQLSEEALTESRAHTQENP
jgi:polar amino acid transport system substrate-binding protein